MAKAKQVLDVRVSKGITTSQSNEHQRRWTEKGWEQALEKGNYDPSREHLNFEIVSGKVRPVDKSRSIPERMAEILDRRGIKDPNEGWTNRNTARWSISSSAVPGTACANWRSVRRR